MQKEMNYSRCNNGDYCTTYFPFNLLGKKNRVQGHFSEQVLVEASVYI